MKYYFSLRKSSQHRKKESSSDLSEDASEDAIHQGQNGGDQNVGIPILVNLLLLFGITNLVNQVFSVFNVKFDPSNV